MMLPLMLTAVQKMQDISQNSSTTDTKTLLQDFTAILSLSLMTQMMSSLNSANSGDSALAGLLGNSTGSSSGSDLLSTLAPLYEQLLSQQIQGSLNTNKTTSQASPTFASSKAAAGSSTSGSSASSNRGGGVIHHINQFNAAIAEGGSGQNADCGPTSLVMALHQIGLNVKGETSGTSDGKAIDLARLSMASSSATDGVDASGRRSNAEHDTFTNFNDLARGAAAAGAKETFISPSAGSIQSALQSGASVIVSGTFAGKYPPPWTGNLGFDNNSAPGNATSHLIEVSSYDPSTNTFTIQDPCRTTSNQVSGSALERFMAGNAGAMALRR
ncbi:MAG: C39 family peptidase [Anaerolineaceae bacterium]|nr:C39 family peptidase [Anaerolineaceae bacterium]